MFQRNTTGAIREYLRIDEPMQEEESQHHSTILPTEFLNTITPKVCLNTI
jgi:hypothetical protein